LGGQTFSNAGVPQLGPGVGRDRRWTSDAGSSSTRTFTALPFAPLPLRNIELTAPYMHDGAFCRPRTVLKHYNDVPKALREYDSSKLPPAVQQMYHGDDATISTVLTNLDGRLRQPLA